MGMITFKQCLPLITSNMCHFILAFCKGLNAKSI